MRGKPLTGSLRRFILAIVVTTIPVIVVLTIFGPIVVSGGPITVTLLPALVVLSWLLAGMYGVTGTAIGYVGYQLAHGGVSPWMIGGIWAFGIVASILETAPSTPEKTIFDTRWLGRSVLRFIATVALASISAGTIIAWGFEISYQFRFFPSSVFLAINWIISTALFGMVGFLLLTQSMTVNSLRTRIAPVRGTLLPSGSTPDGWPVELVLVPVAWFLAGNVLSVGFQWVERVPPVAFRSRGLEVILILNESWLFGPGGAKLQVALGTVCLVWILVVLWRWKAGIEST